MKPASFDYIRADSLDEALDALSEHGDDAKLMAGGQSLMPMLNIRLVRPAVVIDISRLGDLDYARAENGRLEVGAAYTQGNLAVNPLLAEKAPLLAKALEHVGHFQTRNRGTVCGSLCHSDPSSEIPLCLATLGGSVVLRSKKREREVEAADFQIDMLTTDCRSDEMAVEAVFPAAGAGTGFAFTEIARRHGDFAIVALAAMATGDAVRLGVGGVASTPTVREWPVLQGSDLDDALNEFAWDLGGSDDIHATARYRREMVRTLGRKVIQEALNDRAA